VIGPAEASPEGNPELKPGSIAEEIFGEKCHPTAVEAERTFVGFYFFQAVLKGDASKFPSFSAEDFKCLQDFTFKILEKDTENYESYKEIIIYSLLCNDLGKTKLLVDKNIEYQGRKADDHDLLLLELVRSHPELFPGLQTLSLSQQQHYKEGLEYYFNVGQFIQGENLPYNLAAVPKDISQKSKELRLLEELFDLAGAAGHINNSISLVVNSTNYATFLKGIDIVLSPPKNNENDPLAIYQKYLLYRAELVGLQNEKDWYILGRLASLSRAMTPSQGQEILKVWNALLPPPARATLSQEMIITGMMEEGEGKQQKGILIYYYPAVIANAIKLKRGNFSEGLLYALERIALVFQETRRGIVENQQENENENGVVIVNVSKIAKDIANEVA
jgi:hypothetical protein